MRFFQTLDDFERNCLLYYTEGALFTELTEDSTHTWNYRPYLDDGNTEFVKLYTQGKTLTEVCPEGIRDSWLKAKKKMNSHLKAIATVGADLADVCYLDLIPENFLKKYLYYKNEITRHVFESAPRPANYEFFLKLERLLSGIAERKVNTTLHSGARIVYNAHKSATGRLTVSGASFPILNLKTELRKEISPNNHLFVELDFNAADLRTFLALSGRDQPAGDIHDWNDENIFGRIGRQEAKRGVFSWLYDETKKNNHLSRVYDREGVKKKYYDKEKSLIKTPYGREIKTTDAKALSYIIQSTSNDIFLSRAFAVNDMLKGRESYIAFLMHDSLIIDLSTKDQHLVQPMAKAFSETEYGSFKVNLKIGKNYGDMETKK